MYSKLSMKNLHTFSQDNPFVRDRSISSRSKHELQFGSSRKEEFKGVEDILRTNVRKSHHQYNHEMLRDSTNTPDTGFFKSQLYRQSSTLQKQPRTNANPYPKHPSIPSKSHPSSCSSILHLLSQQKHCIQKIRQTVERDKVKIHGNFQDFKQTICNIIDDLKLSVCASVDAQFQYFVDSFRIVKVQYANYCNVKKEFWGSREGEVEKAEREGKRGLGATVYPGMIRGDGKEINNQHLLLSVIEDIKDCKKHINYVQFSQIQQRLLGPLLQTTKNLVNQLNIESYYNPQIAHETFKTLQESIEQQVHKMYQKMDCFITDHIRQEILQKQAKSNIKGKQNIILQEEQRKRNKQKIENNYNNYNNERNRQISPIAKKNRNQHKHEYQHQQLNKNQSQSQQKQTQKHQHRAQVANKQYGSHKQVMTMKAHAASPLNQEEIYISKNTIQIQPVQPQELIYSPKQTANDLIATHKNQKNVSTANTDFYHTNKNKFETQSDYVNENQTNLQPTHSNSHKQLKLSFSNPQKQKKLSSPLPLPQKYKLQEQPPIKLHQTRTITDHRLSKSASNSETALCIAYLGNNKVAVGTKNGIIKIFCTKTGVKLNQLYGHTASICSLADVGNGEFIGSGGDIGCCQLMLWRVKGEELYHNFSQQHNAAITSILDLNDNKHFISGSFDCNLNIYSIPKKQLIKSTSTSHKITFLSRCTNNSKQKQKTDQILSGNLNSQICVWKINKNTFNTITGIVLLRSINIGTYPYSVVGWGHSGEEVLVVGKDDWVRVIDYGKGSVEKGTKLGQFTQLISIDNQGQNVCLGCHKNGNIFALDPINIQDENMQQKKSEIIGQGCPISYSCGISRKWAIASNPPTLFMPNHNNQSETEIKVWRIYPGGIKLSHKNIEEQQNFNNEIDDLITGHTY